MNPGPGASKSDWRQYFREQLDRLAPADRASASAQLCQHLEARPEWQQARSVLLFVPSSGEPDILPMAQAALAAGKIVTFPRYSSATDSYEAARVGMPMPPGVVPSRPPLPRSERGRGSGRGGEYPEAGLTAPKGPPLPGPLLPQREEREPTGLVPVPGGSPHVADLARDLAPGRFGIPEPLSECSQFPLKELDFCLVPGLGFALDGGRLGRGRGYFDRLLAAIPGFKCGAAFDCQVVPGFALEPHDVRLDCILTPTRWHLTASRARS